MAAKFILAMCASALLVQTISAQYYHAPATYVWTLAPAFWSPNCGAANLASDLGGLSVTTFSPLVPNGISVLSENYISGFLGASGNFPVLATVALGGSLSTSGSAGTSYSCGNGQVGIYSDSIAAADLSAIDYGVSYGAASVADTAANAFDSRAFTPAYDADTAVFAAIAEADAAAPAAFNAGAFTPVAYAAPYGCY